MIVFVILTIKIISMNTIMTRRNNYMNNNNDDNKKKIVVMMIRILMITVAVKIRLVLSIMIAAMGTRRATVTVLILWQKKCTNILESWISSSCLKMKSKRISKRMSSFPINLDCTLSVILQQIC